MLQDSYVSIASAPHPPYPLAPIRACQQMLVQVSIASAPHPPYPRPCDVNRLKAEEEGFQSHLRLIHPIHATKCCYHRWKWNVSIASAPHPPYPPVSHPRTGSAATIVSIASAPHPPYPRTLSSWKHTCRHLFQSHLRLIHPIHNAGKEHSGYPRAVSIASAPHPPYPLALQAPKGPRKHCFNRICASSTLSTKS